MISAIILDSREPDHLKYMFPDCSVQMLDAGDLWCATDDNQILIIERKTPSDLLNTIGQDRLFSQCARMREYSPWCYLVITGHFYVQSNGHIQIAGRETGWLFSAIQGALLTVQELGVGVIHCNGEEDYAACIERLSNRERGEIHIDQPRQPHILSAGESFLAALPGIGIEKAQALLKHCDTPAWALSYLTRYGENGVPGVGDGIKRSVRKALGLSEEMELWPISHEKDS